MIANSHLIPTLNPHRFKPPSLLHKISASQTHISDFQKRYYKNIHHLNLELKDKSFPKRMSMPKTLHSLYLHFHQSVKHLPIMKELVKTYKKHLRRIQGDANHPKIQKLLPLLTDLKVSLTRDSFRILSFHSNVKKLRFNMASVQFRRMSGEELLRKYKAPLSRGLAKIKDLRALPMTIMSREIQAANLMLQIIDQNVSMKEFSLSFYFDPFLPDFQKLHDQKESISKVHEKLTHLSTCQFAWYSFLSSSGELANLSVLQLQLTSKEISWDSKDLLQFHRLPKLHKFTLDVTGHSLPHEETFFESLTFPPSLEDLNFTLAGFALSLTDENHASYTQFFTKLQEAKRVKALNLMIIQNSGQSSKTAKFSCLFIKCFGKLEVLDYKNLQGSSSGSRKSKTKMNPLDFQEFLAAVTPSKETLQSISVSFPLIIFPEGVDPLEVEFPRLQKLQLQKCIWPGTELGRFCQRIPNLRDLTLEGVKLKDEERLEIFLDGLKEIPEEGDFKLYLNVENIQQDLLIDYLMKYIEDVEVRGRLGMHFTGIPIEELQGFGEIMEFVLKKKCVESFQMERKDQGRLFYVNKTNSFEISMI